MNIGDFVSFNGINGRILKVEKLWCLVLANGLIQKVPKPLIKVTVPVEDHIRTVAEELAKIPYDEDY